jgi:hypothetical protein
MESSIFAMATSAACGETPGGGSRLAVVKARAGVRIGAILHPTMLLTFADGMRFVLHFDRPTAQRLDRGPPFFRRQHRVSSVDGTNP